MNDSEPIRVCHLVGDLGSGGRKSLLLDLVRATDDATVEHFLACFQSDEAARREFERAGVGIESVDAGSRHDLGALKRTLDLFRARRFDVVHTHGPNAQIPGRVLARLARASGVVSTHHTMRTAHGRVTVGLERLTRPLDTATVAVSRGVRQSFGGHGRWHTIPNGIDTESFNRQVTAADPSSVAEEWGVTDRGPIYLNVGRYVPDKAQIDLIGAMEAVTDRLPRAHLFVVGGRGTIGDRLDREVERRNLGDAVTVTGRVQSIHEYYALADAFVLSSVREGLPIVLLEAMAAELPVVATDIPGVREVVADGETGFVIPPRSSSALAERMVDLGAAERRAELSSAGFERVRSEFDIERTARAYVSLYFDVLGRAGDGSEHRDGLSHTRSEEVR